MEYQQTSGSARPFSSTNPFRTGGVDSSIQSSNLNNRNDNNNNNTYIDDNNNWNSYGAPHVIQNEFKTSPMYNNSNGSNTYAVRPAMTKRSSTNPFLDDAAVTPEHSGFSSPQQVESGDRAQFSPPQYKDQSPHMTAKEEKEQLRRRYIEQSNVSEPRKDFTSVNHIEINSQPPPPSYEEITDFSSSNRYAREKQTLGHDNVNANRSHSNSIPSMHHSHNNNRGNHPSDMRPQRHHSTVERTQKHHYHSSGRGHGSSTSSRNRKDKRKSMAIVSKNVDTIDKLDVTGLFGGSFHHDGPFDACTPHRNKNNKSAPVLAFPVDGPNSTIGGATTKKSAMSEVFGVDDIDDDSFLYSTKHYSSKDALRSSASKYIQNVDTKNKTQQVHGVETYGLGSSTFLDGAPAVGTVSRNLGIQRGKTISYRTPDSSNQRNNYDSVDNNGFINNNTNIRRNLSTNSRPTVNRYNSFDSVGRDFSTGEVRNSVTTRSTDSSQVDFRRDFDKKKSQDEAEDDIYLSLNGGTDAKGGVRFNNAPVTTTKKASAGSKLLKRVKSLKVSSRRN